MDQETLVTSGFRGNSIYECAAHKSLITILCTTHLYFISICMHSCRRILDPVLFPSIEHNIKQSKLERSGKHKIKSTSKSCRRFLYTTLAMLPKVRLNLGLLGKKLTILQSIIRIEGIIYQAQYLVRVMHFIIIYPYIVRPQESVEESSPIKCVYSFLSY